MSASFTNQVMAQLDLHRNAATYGKKVFMLPKQLDEEVARLHLAHLGVKLTTLTKEQADYIGVPVDGPVQGGALPVLIERRPMERGRGHGPAYASGGSARARRKNCRIFSTWVPSQ